MSGGLDEFCAAMDERKFLPAPVLVDVYSATDIARRRLYELLAEREPHQSISHKRMPTWDEHCAFFDSRPYLHWYFFNAGAVYLSRQREIGIGVLKEYRRQGLGRAAVVELMRLHPGQFLANINPANEPSARLFKSLGFGLIQHTYAHG